MRRGILYALIGIVAFAWATGTEAASMTMLDFMKARSERRWTRVPRKVLAFYYTWYGTPKLHKGWIHWEKVDPDRKEIAASTDYPEIGAYDSHDPEVIDRHIAQAKAAGIDGFITTWWGPGLYDDENFPRLLDHAAKADFEATVYWETAPGEGEEQIERAAHDLLYILNNYGSHPAFLKVDGKPVVFVYGRVMGQVPLRAWQAILSRVETAYDGEFLLIADGYTEAYARLFDGVHTYNPVGWVVGKTPKQLREASRRNYTEAVALARRNGKIAAVTVIPGYDDTKIRTPGLNAHRWGGDTYRVLWEEAIAADPDWVLITSWNEWHEGSEIEPSWQYGDQYLALTGEYTARFKATPYAEATVSEAAGGVSPEAKAALRTLFAGKRIGILPDFTSSAVFWLADADLPVEELTWGAVAEGISPERYPVLVYAGQESYTRTVHEDGDVERGLIAYLRAGGFLVALAAGPFPFYYDEEGNGSAVHAATLGFPILGSGATNDDGATGWERPPSDVTLRFELDTERLPSLPESAPFAAVRDPRWRPIDTTALAEGDRYVSLARLVDESGKAYGDGIAYIEHRASEPKGGRNLYVWQGMTDTLDANALFADLFRFIGEQLH